MRIGMPLFWLWWSRAARDWEMAVLVALLRGPPDPHSNWGCEATPILGSCGFSVSYRSTHHPLTKFDTLRPVPYTLRAATPVAHDHLKILSFTTEISHHHCL